MAPSRGPNGSRGFRSACLLLLLLAVPPSLPSMTPRHLEVQMTKPEAGTGPCRTMTASRGLLPGHRDSVNCLYMPDDGEAMMLSGSDDGTARMWDLATLKCISSFAARRKEGDDPMPVNSVSMRGRHIYLAAGPFVLEYDTKMPAEHDVETVLSMSHATASTQLGDSDISQMQVSHDGSQLAAVDEDGAVWVMDLSTRAVAMLPERHDGIGTCLAWRSMISPWNKELVTGGMDMRLLVHQSDKKVLLHELRTSDKAGGKGGSTLFNPPFVHAIDVSAEGRWMIVGAEDGALRVYDLMDPKLTDKYEGFEGAEGHVRSVTCVAFPSEGAQYRCVTGSDDKHIKIWNLAENDIAPDGNTDRVILDINHGIQPNWILCRSIGAGGQAPHLFVADTSNTISTYTFKA